MMCLNDASQDITKDIEAVGTGSSDTADIFNPLPAIALTKMQELRDNNTKMKNMLNSITLSKWTFMTSGLSSSAAATVNAQSNLMGSTLQLAQTNQAIASQYFIPITTTDLIKNYPGFHNSKQYISTSMAWVGGKRELKNMTKLPQSILEIIDKYIPRSQLPKQTTHILLNVDGQTATSWLPEADLFQQIKDTITTHRTQYLKLKTAYQTALAALQAEQAALIKNNYNCQ